MIRSLRDILLLSAAVASASNSGGSAPKAHQLDESYTFEQYLSHFEKFYDDPEEYNRRSYIFAKNMDKILRHNEGRMNEDGVVLEGYVMGVNMFTDVESHELPMGYNKAHHPAWKSQLSGAIARTERSLGATDTVTASYSKPPDFDMDEVERLPVSVDWVAEGKVNPIIPHQGGCGSCWTFAATATVESHLAIATGEEPMSLSEQNMMQCTPDPNHCGGTGGCKGATVELGLNYIADVTAKNKGGMFSVDDVPYHADKEEWARTCKGVTKGRKASVGIEGWTQLPANSYKAAMNSVAKVGPVAIAVAANGWSHYEKGVFDTDETTVNHAVVLVGYGIDEITDEKYYKIRNSWGPKFGEDGYIRIKRTDNDDNECGMDDEPLVGLACALDDNGNEVDVQPVKICGTAGILFDVSYPVGVHHIN
eukprot:CAMPEP_0172578568 /NCGR_PEP_ID=MMETSP1067-20121228/138803_1 /TAXON_ID=265564 ORGANISM="Thalassiosira punctigera, Strain Tpunct2005C2" /NCGR_SAMPLE_ID=MMETSP1067 /ASSEMBLY_ACC=CAM_ASM_000444 /LENGTH=421 /DNA_ID=CAMNT_0013371265 /DNA_START=46 /DNA_END=1311 /DNA_ORIENTATION=-